MIHPLYDRLGQLQRALSEISHHAHVAHWELGGNDISLALEALSPLPSQLERAAKECRVIIAALRKEGGAL